MRQRNSNCSSLFARNLLCELVHWEPNSWLNNWSAAWNRQNSKFLLSNLHIFIKVPLINKIMNTFHNSSEIAPQRTSRWVISFGLRIPVLWTWNTETLSPLGNLIGQHIVTISYSCGYYNIYFNQSSTITDNLYSASLSASTRWSSS